MKESMFATVISGSVSLIDDSEHYEHLPIVGQERLTMVYESFEEIYTQEFFIYKISDISKENQRTSSYTLFFVSVEEMVNESIRVRRSFSNMKYSTMIESIMKTEIETNKSVAVDPSLNIFTYVSPNVHPFEVVRQLCTKSVSEITQQSDYVFFEDRRGFLCGPISSFSTAEPKFTYRMNEYVGEANPNTPHTFSDPLSILKFSVKKQTDTLDLVSQGIFSSSMTNIDILSRNVRTRQFDYFSEFEKRKHLNRYPLFSNNIQYDQKGNPFYSWSNEFSKNNQYILDRDPFMQTELTSETSVRRRLQLQSYNNNVFSILISGNPFLFVGDVINVDMNISLNGNERKHRTLSGNTLITSISHVIQRSGTYRQRLETSKDSNIGRIGDSL
jgi:hypothetical protein